MTVSARERQSVDDWFREQMGPERARTLMQLLPEQPPTARWWRLTDPGQSFWVQHGTGFFIGEAVGVWITVLLILLLELAKH